MISSRAAIPRFASDMTSTASCFANPETSGLDRFSSKGLSGVAPDLLRPMASPGRSPHFQTSEKAALFDSGMQNDSSQASELQRLRKEVDDLKAQYEACRVALIKPETDEVMGVRGGLQNGGKTKMSMYMDVDNDSPSAGVNTPHAPAPTVKYVLHPHIEQLINKFPLANMKCYQLLFALQSEFKTLRHDLNSQQEISQTLKNEVRVLQNEVNFADLNHVQVKLGHLDGTLQGSASSISTISSATSGYVSQDDVMRGSNGSLDIESSMSDLEARVKKLEVSCKELKDDKDRCKQLERFVMHLHERIKSLDCGRTGCFIWKISGFNSIFENARTQHEKKLAGQSLEGVENTPCDFCSPLFYTAPNGYLMYMRMYPYGCDSAAGKFVSLFIAMSPGEYDGVLPWPFKDSIEISMMSQDGSGDKWTQTITPGGNNLTCFDRPSSKSGNMSVGILHFIIHRKIYTEHSPYRKNDTVYIEVKIRENDTLGGPPRAKAARSV